MHALIRTLTQLPYRQMLTELTFERLRLLLTIIAIAWASASITGMLAVGEGLRLAMQSTIEHGLGQTLSLRGGSVSQSIPGKHRGEAIQFSPSDLDLISAYPQVEAVGVQPIDYKHRVTRGEVQRCWQITGSSSNIARIMDYQMAQGRWFDPLDEQHNRNVIVFGSTVKKWLFQSEQAVGQSVSIGGVKFQVIGILQPVNNFFSSGQPANYGCFVPLGSLNKLKPTYRYDDVFILPKSNIDRDALGDALRQSLLRRQGLDPKDLDQIKIQDSKETRKKLNRFFIGLQIFLGLVGFISLAVAGVGIANVMLITVRRATRDIGVRMALGARDGHILFHYLLQALVTVLTGGLLGLSFIALLSWGFTYIPIKLPFYESLGKPTPTLSLLVTGVVMGALLLIGLVSAYLPARNAARIDPVLALQHE